MDGIEMAGMEGNEGAFAEEDVTKEDTRESCANMEEGGEADGGYSSNSCNGGEDGVEDCEDGEEGAVDGIDDKDVRGENVEEGENGWEENYNEEQDGSQEDYDPFNAVEEAADAEPTSNTLNGLNGHEESEAFFENASEVMLGHSDLDDTLAGLSESNKNFVNNTLDDADEQKEQSEHDEPAEPHEEAEHEEQSEHDERADNDEQAAAANSTEMLGANMMDMTENINPNDHNAGESNSKDHIGENEDGGEETGDTDADGEMSIKIGSVSSIQTVVHEDLSRWGATLEAEGDNDEEGWENGTEKEINGQKDKEAADTEEEDIEYDNAILKAMQESIVENNDKGEKEKGTEDDSREDELTLDGVPEVAETVGFTDDEVEDNEIGEANPFDDIDPYVETEEDFFKAGADVGYDPLNDGGDDIGTDENTSGFLDQVNSGALPMVVDLPKQVRGPYKKKRSYGDDDSGEDSDEYIPFDDEPGRKEPRKAGKSATSVDPNDKNAVIFKCLVCSFPFDTLGQMKIHKYADHENEEKPSYLDLIEAAIMAKKNRKTGVSKNLLLQEAMREPSVTDPKTKAVYLLSKALKAGLARGRLMVAKHQPKNGGQNYRLASKPNRKKVLAKWLKNKRAVEYKDIDDFGKKSSISDYPREERTPRSYTIGNSSLQITPVRSPKPDPKKFGRGKRAPKHSNSEFGGVTLVETDDSDDEIMVVAEKITPKTKMKLMHKQQKRLGMPPGSGRGGRGGRGAVRGRGRPPSVVVTPKKAATVAKVSDGFEDEDDLTCRVCLSSFWYRNQLVEHLRNTHSVKDPETFLRERRSRV